ncbi:alpha/beta fold hydrolase [Sinomonas sp. ASV486]|uniref:alpha/beta fold hydrolase n=1 Tax=Sinomonas sp. ASV486 TaxID=3051170 RepID=UPI0027DD0E9B|nr:alpha/beta fold hydrolase [Sinomonas sp. ASV486]MDQ4489382.1 alpha/beta fold hydrolase [Sinomonas sp. ASV486]
MSVPKIKAVRLSPREQLGQKELVVLGPSLGTSTVMWQDAAQLFAGDYDVFGWDLPGHGVSPAAATDAEFSVGELADAVVELVDSIEPGVRFHYAGDSVGGATGAELALRHPERLLSLAMVCSSPRFNGAEAYAERADAVAEQGTEIRLEPSAEIWFAPGFLGEHPTESSRLLDSLRDADRFGYAAVCRAIAAYDVRDRFAEISVPFLAVAGQFDSVCPLSEAQWMADQAQHGVAVEVPNVGHIAPTENPALVASLLRTHFMAASGLIELAQETIDALVDSHNTKDSNS